MSDPKSTATEACVQGLRNVIAADTGSISPVVCTEPMTRFCPGCGSVGEVDAAYRDCCPDGSHARVIPESLARRCNDLFYLALRGAVEAEGAPVDNRFDWLEFERIGNLPEVDEAIRALLADQTEDNATGVIRAAIEAAAGQLSRLDSQAIRDVLGERQRQIDVEGWTPEHDDEHKPGELAQAAACYALFSLAWPNAGRPPGSWPWDSEWWKPKGIRSGLVRAGALILAEIERHDRAEQERTQAPAGDAA